MQKHLDSWRRIRTHAVALGAMLRASARNASGTAATEFALVAPIVLTLVVALADFGLGVHSAIELNSAARVGAQYGQQNPTDTAGISAAANASISSKSQTISVSSSRFCECPDGSAIACDGVCPTGASRVYVRVTVSDNYVPLIPYPYVPTSLNLNGTAIMRVQ